MTCDSLYSPGNTNLHRFTLLVHGFWWTVFLSATLKYTQWGNSWLDLRAVLATTGENTGRETYGVLLWKRLSLFWNESLKNSILQGKRPMLPLAGSKINHMTQLTTTSFRLWGARSSGLTVTSICNIFMARKDTIKISWKPWNCYSWLSLQAERELTRDSRRLSATTFLIRVKLHPKNHGKRNVFVLWPSPQARGSYCITG